MAVKQTTLFSFVPRDTEPSTSGIQESSQQTTGKQLVTQYSLIMVVQVVLKIQRGLLLLGSGTETVAKFIL